MTRDEQLHRAAELRAAIIGLLSNKDRLVPRNVLVDELQEKMVELEIPLKSFDNTLYRMVNAKLVKSVTSEDNHRVKLYGVGGGLDSTALTTITTKKPTTRIQKSPSTQAIKIDLVKSTGRVRITFNNYVVEVGVVD